MLFMIFLMSISTVVFFISSIFGAIFYRLFGDRKQDLLRSSRDKAILITGCDSGIGLAIARHFLTNHEFTVICTFYQEKGELIKLYTRDESSKRLLMLKLDVTSEKDIENLKLKLQEWKQADLFTNLWAVINNSGRLVYGEFDWLTSDQITEQIDVNISGTISVTKAVLPFLIESKGRLINVSSVNDTIAFPGTSIYSATKSAISTLSRALGYELRKFGCEVVVFRPGDYARLTRIMSKHEEDKDRMWNHMSEDKKVVYSDYFELFHKYLSENYGMTSPNSMEESPLFKDFDKAVLSKNPPNTVTSAPFTHRVIYYVLEFLPIWLQYLIMDVIFEIGFRWSSAKRIKINRIN